MAVYAFVDELAASDLEAAQTVRDAPPASWDAILRLLARGTTRPSVVVIDELPYLMAGDASLEGVLQRSWDRELSGSPVLVVLIGPKCPSCRFSPGTAGRCSAEPASWPWTRSPHRT